MADAIKDLDNTQNFLIFVEIAMKWLSQDLQMRKGKTIWYSLDFIVYVPAVFQIKLSVHLLRKRQKAYSQYAHGR